MTLLTASIYAPPRMSVRVGVGAVVVNEAGYVLLIRRGPEARNEQGDGRRPVERSSQGRRWSRR